jgi:hypothetical protein
MKPFLGTQRTKQNKNVIQTNTDSGTTQTDSGATYTKTNTGA